MLIKMRNTRGKNNVEKVREVDIQHYLDLGYERIETAEPVNDAPEVPAEPVNDAPEEPGQPPEPDVPAEPEVPAELEVPVEPEVPSEADEAVEAQMEE